MTNEKTEGYELRLERLLDHQRVIAGERNQARVGLRTAVMVEETVDGEVLGRAAWQAPEVDGVVQIEGAGALEPGRFVDVVITGADDHDLTGRIAECSGGRLLPPASPLAS
jgi:ribosomal protein S12 methylthiotransferase